MLKWYWQLIIYLIALLIAFFFFAIVSLIKYFIFWSFDREWLSFKLAPIWQKSIIEIQGGAETGKTLLIVLLTRHLMGRKWSNVPNIVPGWQKLTLPLLKKHWLGEFEDGIVGVNNVLLIDEPWNFFSRAELKKHNLYYNNDLSKILWFMSETSKTNWKIIYVKKMGIPTPEPFKLLEANKSLTLRTLGLRKYCFIGSKQYYYLDVELIDNNEKTKAGSTKYKEIRDKSGRQVWKPKTSSWWQRWFSGMPFFKSAKIISIPVSWEDLCSYDKSWNLDAFYAKNRQKSIYWKLGADGLIEGTKIGQSRRQRLREENETILWWKRHPDPARKKQMTIKGYELAKQRGLYKSADEKIAEQENKLKKELEEGKITSDDYKEEMNKVAENKRKLAEVIAKTYPEPPESAKEKPAKVPPLKKNKEQKYFSEEEE